MAHFDLSYWHATTKTYAYFREFGFIRIFFCQKSDPTMVKSHFKNTMGNPFFEAQFFETKRSKFFFRIVIIWYFMEKLLSDSILDLAKCPNQKTCTFTFMRFLVGALPEVQNCF
jgi:hypothetical protein